MFSVSGTSIFSPNIVSTPGPPHPSNAFSPHSSAVSAQQGGYSNLTYQPAGGIQTNFPQPIGQQTTIDLSNFVNYSAKHNGLYLYLGRILRPLWNKGCVERICTDGKNMMVNFNACTHLASEYRFNVLEYQLYFCG